MRVVKAKNNFFDPLEIGELVELCENMTDAQKNIELQRILRNTGAIMGKDRDAIDPSKNVELRSKIREKKEKTENILAKKQPLFRKPLQVQICKNILENIIILQKRINYFDTIYNEVIRTYSREDGVWAGKVFLALKKNPNLKLIKTPEEKTKFDNFKKFFNTINNIKVSTDDDKALSTSIDNLFKYCQRTVTNLKVSKAVYGYSNSSKEGNVVNRYTVALKILKNAYQLTGNINRLISSFANFNHIIPIGSKSYTDLIKDLNNIINKILTNLKDIMGDN